MALIQGRRSLYPPQYSGERIDDTQIDTLLEAARWAPTHKLTQPWRFVVYTDGGIERLVAAHEELMDGLAPPEKTLKFVGKLRGASHVILIGMARDERESLPEIEEVMATACAVQNMQLMAKGLGLGCYWSTGALALKEEGKRLMGLGAKDLMLGYLFLGVPRISEVPAGPRKAVREIARWER